MEKKQDLKAEKRMNLPYAKKKKPESKQSIFQFTENIIVRLKQLGKERTAETYTTALNSFRRFCKSGEVFFEDIDSDLIEEYEAYLKASGITPNTISFYNRILRAVYNRAVEKGMTGQEYPFKNVYTGMEKTVKRAISIKVIKRIKGMDLSAKPMVDFARDMFLFSFYTRGMSFVDMAYLKKSDLKNGILSYRRKKTGQQLYIKWEDCMQEIVEKHPNDATEYLLPIINRRNVPQRRQYKNALHLVNHRLKEVARMVELSIPLTTYVARHTWANVARNKNIPLAVISEGMGHESESTTRIYLASLDTATIDKANKMILKALKDY